ncbi:MAG: 3-oxoacyl-[acyl-carrier protein] reductase [Hyphomicrobiaceae bacterium]
MVEGLLAGGAHVFAGYHRNAAGLAAIRDSSAADRLDTVQFDVADPTAVDSAVRDIVKSAGKLDLLVHSAGVAFDGLLLRSKPEQVDACLSVNLASAVSCARSVLPSMLKARYGRIVFVSSVVASMGNAGQGLYAAAKAGVEGLSRSLAREVGSRGITVNTVSPGFIDTEMTSGMSEDDRRRVIESTAVGRLGQPADVAHSALFFCDESAGYVTGTTLQVGGGLYM